MGLDARDGQASSVPPGEQLFTWTSRSGRAPHMDVRLGYARTRSAKGIRRVFWSPKALSRTRHCHRCRETGQVSPVSREVAGLRGRTRNGLDRGLDWRTVLSAATTVG